MHVLLRASEEDRWYCDVAQAVRQHVEEHRRISFVGAQCKMQGVPTCCGVNLWMGCEGASQMASVCLALQGLYVCIVVHPYLHTEQSLDEHITVHDSHKHQ